MTYSHLYWDSKILKRKTIPMHLPVCTLSPIFSSDIVNKLLFSSKTLAEAGKQDFFFGFFVVVVVGFGHGHAVKTLISES